LRRILGEDLAHAEGFDLKCLAMKQVREEMGLSNVILMLPFVRRIKQADDKPSAEVAQR
jgi:phosphoenolpyruvate synthase/pyruvate phosphate dikinase